MESKSIAFFAGPSIKKIDKDTNDVQKVNAECFSVNNVWVVNDSVKLIPGDDDKTGTLDLNNGSMFLTMCRYNYDEGGYRYYRFLIQSEELKNAITQWIAEEKIEKNKKDLCLCNNVCEASC